MEQSKEQKKRVAFLTLGCKVNAYETNAMEQLFQEAGYLVINFEESADIYIINTCTVTNIADRKSRQMLHKAKKKNSESIVVAVGCYVQEAGELLKEDKAIDLVVGNNQKKHIVEIVENFLFDHKLQETVLEIEGINEYESLFIQDTAEKTRAYIKVQDGCNQFCSYCIIPYVRGRVRSRKLEEIKKEVEGLVEKGYKEIVLTGIHLSSYGSDFLEKKSVKQTLLDLIIELSKINKLERIRLGSLEPRIITETFIKALVKNKKFCPHFHLSLQSGCNETLKRMNRHYTTEEYEQKCELIRKYFYYPAITTDIIVGFPGETEIEFLETKKFLEKISFSKMHIFKYSKRKGTKAEIMPAQVSEQIKIQRSNLLLDLEKRLRMNYYKEFIGKKETILIEEEVTIEGKNYQIGYSKRYIKMVIETEKLLINQLIEVVGKNLLNEEILLCEMI